MNRSLYALTALAASFALFTAACGGDDGGGDDTTEAESTATAAATTQVTTTAEAAETTSTPERASTSEGTGSPASGGEVTGLEEVFDSYHHAVTMEMSVDGMGQMFALSTEGDFVAPDRRSATTTSGAAGFNTTLETVTIGDTTWVREGTGQWTEYTAATVPLELGIDSMAPSDLELDPETRAQIGEMDGTPETLNGRETTRYELDEEFYQSMASVMGETFNPSDFEEFSSTIWIDDETQQAIKMELLLVALPTAFGADLEGLPIPPEARITINLLYELSQINEDSIAIEPPTG